MTTIQIKQLYNFNRFPQNILTILLYLPFGIVLVLLRLVIFLNVIIISLMFPSTDSINSVLLKLLCITFGVSVNVLNGEKKEEVETYVSNHVSLFDHMVVKTLTNCVMPRFKPDTLLSPIFGEKYFGNRTVNQNTFKDNVEHFTAANGQMPLYFQPEAKRTNGRAVLKLDTWPFEFCNRVQPIAIKVHRPILDIAVTTFNAAYWVDVFFFMFSPLTVYNVHFLPSLEKKVLGINAMAQKVQEDIAKSLKVEPAKYTKTELLEWQRLYIIEQKAREQRKINNSPTMNPELQRMSMQVKEVLPLVPLNVIMKDLVKTRNVDVTITNILEGYVSYTPETPTEAQQQQPSTSTSSLQAKTTDKPTTSASCQPQQQLQRAPFNTSASSFGKSANERTMSFQERKQQLIENARRRYIEKHGLNFC